MKIIFLPGLDGTGLLFLGLVKALSSIYPIEVISINALVGYSYADQAREIAGMVAGEDVLIVAESYSGRIAYELCGMISQDVVGIVFIASFITLPSSIARFSNLLPLCCFKPYGVNKWLLSRFGFSGGGTKAMIDAVYQSLAVTNTVKLKARLKNISQLDIPKRKISIPALYIQPSGDLLVSKNAYREIERVFSNTFLVSVQGGHFVAQSNPYECAESIGRFANQVCDQ